MKGLFTEELPGLREGMVRYPETSNDGMLSALSLREMRSVEGDGECQAGAGVTKKHSHCWCNPTGHRRRFNGFGKLVQKENNQYIYKSILLQESCLLYPRKSCNKK